MDSALIFFVGILCLSLLFKFVFLQRLVYESPFDRYLFHKFRNLEWWQLENETTCEYQLRFSPNGTSVNSVIAEAYEYNSKIKHIYLISRGKYGKNKVKRIRSEKICFGMVGLP